MKKSDVKFKIDLKKLETGKPVWIGKDLYAKTLTDSIEIYEIKPLEITPEEKESISEALKTHDKIKEIICEKIPPILLLIDSLTEKYCENCLGGIDECYERYHDKTAICELSYLRFHNKSYVDEWYDFKEDINKVLDELKAE